MHGRQPRLAADVLLVLQLTGSGTRCQTEYAKDLKKRLETTCQVAQEAMKKAASRAKGNYDLRVRGAVPEEGDLVLIRLVGLTSKHKLADKWESETYRIVKKPDPEMPVYVVHRCDGTGNDRTLHRNMLFPLSLPLSETLNEPAQTVATDEGESDITRKRVTRVTPAVRDDDSDSDEEHYLQFKDPRFFFMGTRNEIPGEMATASEDSDMSQEAEESVVAEQASPGVESSEDSEVQFGVLQAADEPLVEEHASPVVERSSSETQSSPLSTRKYQEYMPANALSRWHISFVPTDSFCSWVEATSDPGWCHTGIQNHAVEVSTPAHNEHNYVVFGSHGKTPIFRGFPLPWINTINWTAWSSSSFLDPAQFGLDCNIHIPDETVSSTIHWIYDICGSPISN